MLPTMQGLVEDVMYFSQGKIPIPGGDATYQYIYRSPVLPHGMINQQAHCHVHIKDYIQSYQPQRTVLDSSWIV